MEDFIEAIECFIEEIGMLNNINHLKVQIKF